MSYEYDDYQPPSSEEQGLVVNGATQYVKGKAQNDSEAALPAGTDSVQLPQRLIHEIPVASLQPNELNPFDTMDDVTYEGLLKSIHKEGISTPLRVMADHKTVLDGHNRLRAALHLGLETVPVVFMDRVLTPEEERDFMLQANLLRRHLNEEQKAAVLARAFSAFFNTKGKRGRKSKLGHDDPNTAASIALKIGVSEKTIDRAKNLHLQAKALAEKAGLDQPSADHYAMAKAQRADAKGKTVKTKKSTQVATVDDEEQESTSSLSPASVKALRTLVGEYNNADRKSRTPLRNAVKKLAKSMDQAKSAGQELS